MSAEVLREAARLMRERAQFAPGGVWSADGYGEVVSGKTEPDADDHLSSYYSDRTICRVFDDDFADEDDANRMAQYLASWPPAVALAVAGWLEAEATAHEAMTLFTSAAASIETAVTIRGAALTVLKSDDGAVSMQADTSAPALTVARAYLGGAS